MIKVNKVGLNVSDQDAAKRFWTETMGFELVGDQPMGEDGSRWIEVRAPGDTVELILYSPTFDESRVGSLNAPLFSCDDIQATHRELSGRGVEFEDAPTQRQWGWWASFKDSDGNLYGLGQDD